MSKAILILDEMPNECLDCELLNGYDNSCVGGKIGYDAIYEDRKKPTWCPLKPMPEKRKKPTDSSYDFGFAKEIDGYNACIDEILGGQNEQDE